MTTLFVGNLAVGVTDDDLRELFARYGEVASASVVIDRNTGRSRGFGFVEMSGGAAAAVHAVNGLSVNGRRLSVSESAARPRPAAPSSPAT